MLNIHCVDTVSFGRKAGGLWEIPKVASGGSPDFRALAFVFPQTMAPRQWSEGTSRNEWLHSRGLAYQEAVLAKTKVSFLEKLFHDWFEKYHWSLDNKTQPDPTVLYVEPIGEAEILKKKMRP